MPKDIIDVETTVSDADIKSIEDDSCSEDFIQQIVNITNSFFKKPQKPLSPTERIKNFYLRLNTVSLDKIREVYNEIRTFEQTSFLTKDEKAQLEKLTKYSVSLALSTPDLGFQIVTKDFSFPSKSNKK